MWLCSWLLFFVFCWLGPTRMERGRRGRRATMLGAGLSGRAAAGLGGFRRFHACHRGQPGFPKPLAFPRLRSLALPRLPCVASPATRSLHPPRLQPVLEWRAPRSVLRRRELLVSAPAPAAAAALLLAGADARGSSAAGSRRGARCWSLADGVLKPGHRPEQHAGISASCGTRAFRLPAYVERCVGKRPCWAARRAGPVARARVRAARKSVGCEGHVLPACADQCPGKRLPNRKVTHQKTQSPLGRISSGGGKNGWAPTLPALAAQQPQGDSTIVSPTRLRPPAGRREGGGRRRPAAKAARPRAPELRVCGELALRCRTRRHAVAIGGSRQCPGGSKARQAWQHSPTPETVPPGAGDQLRKAGPRRNKTQQVRHTVSRKGRLNPTGFFADLRRCI